MTRITRCVCTNQTFTELLAIANQGCLSISTLAEKTGAGQHCRRCLPYLRRCLTTGETEFTGLMPPEPEEAPIHPPAPNQFGRVVMSWSGGKDSAMALHALMQDPRYEVVGLLTTISHEYRRISHHGVREELLMRQAEAIGLPLTPLYFPGPNGGLPSMETFEAGMRTVLKGFRDNDIHLVAHGDIYLQDIRDYRDGQLARVGMQGVYPLWQEDTTTLLRRFQADGFRATITCAEPVLGATFAGAEVDTGLLKSLPEGVDPCGENGEYHSFVYAGPIFNQSVPFTRGEVVERDGRHYADLIPSPAT